MGPDSTDSFAAPILLTESYHVIIPMAINADPGRRYFHDLKIEFPLHSENHDKQQHSSGHWNASRSQCNRRNFKEYRK